MATIGIDLGTTTSEIVFIKDGKAIIIPNLEEGNFTVIPSVVLIEGNEIKVGQKAKNQIILKPTKVVSEVKRKIGTNEVIQIDGRKYTATEISSFILKRLKDIAEFYLGEKVDEAVITVPAAFNNMQRKETKKAGEMAGLKVERIINEPTAAAIAYGINNLASEGNILVYDFGGGTFDVSVLELCEGILDVKCSRGNNNLGGKDIDELLINLITKKFKDSTGIELDVDNPRVKSLLKRVAEEGKVSLSTELNTEIISPYAAMKDGVPVDLDIVITRHEFELLIKDIILKTKDLIDEALIASELDYKNIDYVLLVGGSTRIPYVKNMINSLFRDKVVSGMNPEESIAMGAAIQGSIKNGLEKNIIITDSCSYTLGVEVVRFGFDPIIKRDSKLPAVATKYYVTVEDYQDKVDVRVYEGEGDDVRKNNFIGSFELLDVPKSIKGEERVEITFKYDLNGILQVNAKILSNGKEKMKILTLKAVEEKNKITSIDNKEVIVDEKLISEKNEEILSREAKAIGNREVNNNEKLEDIGILEKKLDDNAMDETIEEVKIEEEEELDENEIYRDTSNIVSFVNQNIGAYEPDKQAKIRSMLQDLLPAIKKGDLKGARKLQLEIVDYMT